MVCSDIYKKFGLIGLFIVLCSDIYILYIYIYVNISQKLKIDIYRP